MFGTSIQLSAGIAMSCCSCVVSEASLEQPRFTPPAPEELEDAPPTLVEPPALAEDVEEDEVSPGVRARDDRASENPAEPSKHGGAHRA